MQLSDPSDEQIKIIKTLGQGAHVIVDSVAGSGKTTTNLHISKNFSDKKILLLTYNSRLKLETRQKVEKLGLKNIEVHSYHAFCVKYYDKSCFRDNIIEKILGRAIEPWPKFCYDIIILDEAQDIKDLFYRLIHKIMKDNGPAQLCVLGDKNQSIYGFSGADQRFITMAPEIYGRDQNWAQTSLSVSFRVTNEIAGFINNCMFGYERIKAQKSGPRVKYIITSPFKYEENSPLLADFKEFYNKFGPDNIFVLAYSVKSPKSPVRNFANKISSLGVPIYVPLSDEGAIKEEETAGKVLFSSFHQSKGLERKYVIIFGFDSSYYKYYAKDEIPLICPNLLYVAATRASEKLVLFHGEGQDYLPFLKKDKLPENVEIVGQSEIKPQYEIVSDQNVTALTRHLPENVIKNALNHIEISVISPPGQDINVPDTIVQKFGLENVTDITGTAIPAIYELRYFGRLTIYNEILGMLNGPDGEFSRFIKADVRRKMKVIGGVIKPDMSVEHLLFLSNIYNSCRSGFVYKLNQISDYNWISEEKVGQFMARIEKVIGPDKSIVSFEEYVWSAQSEARIRIIGRIDCIVGKDIYEFKCTKELSDEHKLQLAIYMYLYECRARCMKIETINEQKTILIAENGPIEIERALICKYNQKIKRIRARTKLYMNYYLYNIKTGEKLQFKSDFVALEKMFNYIIEEKARARKTMSDEEFLGKYRAPINNLGK